MTRMAEIDEVIGAWADYIVGIDEWQELVETVEPKQSGSGPIYELPNPVEGRPDEDFRIADMRELAVTEPHYHPDGMTEFYFVLHGFGACYVGGQKFAMTPRQVVVMPPRTAHFTLPMRELVLAVVTTPPFTPENYIPLTDTDPAVQFDKAQFDYLTQPATV
jgi:mannose-6-phosphate isomerase-like protein (cupin superfamily)